jgi:hypothetical protein
MATYSCSLSPLASVQSTESDTIAFLPVEKSSWGNEVSLTVLPAEPTDDPFLNSLKNDSGRIIAAYQHNVAICRIDKVVHRTEKGTGYWDLFLREELSEFVPTIEPGLGGTSADELAEVRIRRLLLNENLAEETKDMNKIFREVLVRGQGLIHIERSPFPILFRTYGSNPQRFLEIAWILAMMQLKLSGTVVQVDKMILSLEGVRLGVDFVGRRPKRYANSPAPKISVQGICNLSS